MFELLAQAKQTHEGSLFFSTSEQERVPLVMSVVMGPRVTMDGIAPRQRFTCGLRDAWLERSGSRLCEGGGGHVAISIPTKDSRYLLLLVFS